MTARPGQGLKMTPKTPATHTVPGLRCVNCGWTQGSAGRIGDRHELVRGVPVARSKCPDCGCESLVSRARR